MLFTDLRRDAGGKNVEEGLGHVPQRRDQNVCNRALPQLRSSYYHLLPRIRLHHRRTPAGKWQFYNTQPYISHNNEDNERRDIEVRRTTQRTWIRP